MKILGNKISSETKIFNFMRKEYLIDLITNNKLYLKNIKKYEDYYEGKPPLGTYGSIYSNEDRKRAMKIDELKLKGYTSFVSCWTKKTYESYLMWKAYTYVPKVVDSKDADGICLCSSVSDLSNSIKMSNKQLYFSDVHYVEYENEIINIQQINELIKLDNMRVTKVSIDENGNILSNSYIGTSELHIDVNEIYKHIGYCDEDEVRLFYYTSINKNKECDFLDLHEDNRLINKILVSPYASDEYFNEIKDIVRNLNYEVEVTKSSLKIRKYID